MSSELKRNRSTKKQQVELKMRCLELWKLGYTATAIAVMTKKRIDFIKNILYELAISKNPEFMAALDGSPRISIVKNTITIRKIATIKPSDLYELRKYPDGNITLTPYQNTN